MENQNMNLEWYTVKNDNLSNPCPSARYGHTAVHWKDSMFVFGGIGEGRNLEEIGIWIYRFGKLEERGFFCEVNGFRSKSMV